MSQPCVLFVRLEGEINRDSHELPNDIGDMSPFYDAVDRTPGEWAVLLNLDRCIAAESIDTDSSSSYEYYWLVAYPVSFRGPKIVTWTLSICLLSVIDLGLKAALGLTDIVTYQLSTSPQWSYHPTIRQNIKSYNPCIHVFFKFSAELVLRRPLLFTADVIYMPC